MIWLCSLLLLQTYQLSSKPTQFEPVETKEGPSSRKLHRLPPCPSLLEATATTTQPTERSTESIQGSSAVMEAVSTLGTAEGDKVRVHPSSLPLEFSYPAHALPSRLKVPQPLTLAFLQDTAASAKEKRLA